MERDMEYKLPPLPEPFGKTLIYNEWGAAIKEDNDCFTDEQMNDHYIKGYNDAIAAIEAQASVVQQDAASAWQQGYDKGVMDERTSEANIGIAGFAAKVAPARQNPYTHPAQQAKPQPLSDEQIDAGIVAWFATAITTNDGKDKGHPFRERMRAAMNAAHGIQGS